MTPGSSERAWRIRQASRLELTEVQVTTGSGVKPTGSFSDTVRTVPLRMSGCPNSSPTVIKAAHGALGPCHSQPSPHTCREHSPKARDSPQEEIQSKLSVCSKLQSGTRGGSGSPVLCCAGCSKLCLYLPHNSVALYFVAVLQRRELKLRQVK